MARGRERFTESDKLRCTLGSEAEGADERR
jgi:hypothetical protein